MRRDIKKNHEHLFVKIQNFKDFLKNIGITVESFQLFLEFVKMGVGIEIVKMWNVKLKCNSNAKNESASFHSNIFNVLSVACDFGGDLIVVMDWV